MLFGLKDVLGKIDFRKFLQRTLIVFIVVGGIYSAYYILIKQPSNTPKPIVSVASVQISLNQHVLAISALGDIDTNDPSTPYKIEGVRSNIDSTLENYKKEISDFQRSTGVLAVSNPESFVTQEQALLSQYDQNYKELKKLIQYSVKNDLGSLDKNSEIEEIAARSSIAFSSIVNIKQNSRALPKETIRQIDQTLTCLEEINSKAKEKKADELENLINNCSISYEKIKPLVLRDILKPLHSDKLEQLIKDMKLLLDQIKASQSIASF